uniref:radical SAM/SPASM domain-containing protein n=1 Tax=Paractinoplanes polyasparticus TaxID=2856853 RepID=UPI001C84FE96|nr:SPASM domain-containing protein [Actinoplanes polyasparticus]
MRESRYNVWVDDGARTHVYNGVSGRVTSMPGDRRAPLQRFIAGDDDAPADPQLLAAMARAGMIVADGTDELDLLRKRYEATRANPDRFHLTVVTSLGCNLDCPYCFEAKHPSLLGDEVQERLLRLVDRKLSSVRALEVLWYGGEPLVGLPALLALSDEFIARAAAAGVAYSAGIITNGHLLDAETAHRLRARGVRATQVTMDGPREVHDRRRPLAGGRGTFDQLLANVVAVAGILDVTVRVNLDTGNLGDAPRLLHELAAAGLAGRIAVSPGHVVATRVNLLAPSARYHTACLPRAEFAQAEGEFAELADRLGFATVAPPAPSGAPCTAVRDNELVIGSRGEIYKCTETVGDPAEVIGNLLTWPQPGDRLSKWLTYDPFADEDCRSCVALPVCMGGCAYHAMNASLRDSRCSTFRFRHEEQVRRLVRRGPAR